MCLTGKTLIGVLVLCATALASAEGLQWADKGTRATLVPGGVVGTQALNVCRATLGGVLAVGEFANDRSGECRVAVGGQQQAALEFELLAQAAKPDVSFTWVPGHAMGYPQNSVVGGHGADGTRTVVCSAIHTADGSVHPGYIADENCIYSVDGRAATSENYMVLVAEDPDVSTTGEAQPAIEGFDPGAILALGPVTRMCALAQGLCVPPPAR